MKKFVQDERYQWYFVEEEDIPLFRIWAKDKEAGYYIWDAADWEGLDFESMRCPPPKNYSMEL